MGPILRAGTRGSCRAGLNTAWAVGSTIGEGRHSLLFSEQAVEVALILESKCIADLLHRQIGCGEQPGCAVNAKSGEIAGGGGTEVA